MDQRDLEAFKLLLEKYRYEYHRLVYILFPFGEPGHELETMAPLDWQLAEWKAMSDHFKDPAKRDIPYKLAISSGNGIGKSAFFAMTLLMLMYSQKTRARITANTYTQIKNITWVEIDQWARRARFFDFFFEKLGESIKSRDEKLSEVWRTDMFTWDANNPAAISGLHNKGACVFVGIDEAAGVPDVIITYLNGAMTDTDTMKIWLMIGNSDDPESSFERKMIDPNWVARRIDSRTVESVSKDFINQVLQECGGNEDADDFRVRVRGLPRKSSSDSIITAGRVETAMSIREFDIESQSALPCVMTADLAWLGGDFCAIWIHQGKYSLLVDYYKLDKEQSMTHTYTYQRMCMWEKKYKVDYVLIDQAEGTAVFSFAQSHGKYNWELISFASSPNDVPDFKDSQYQNMRAQMYYEAEKWLAQGGVLDCLNPEWRESLRKELCWTKGIRNRTTLKKQAEAKVDIKARVGRSPDMADGFVLRFSRIFYDRLPENVVGEREVYEIEELPYDPYKDFSRSLY